MNEKSGENYRFEAGPSMAVPSAFFFLRPRFFFSTLADGLPINIADAVWEEFDGDGIAG